MRKAVVWTQVVALTLSFAAAALAADKAKVTIPPGWNTKWARTLMCPKCTGMAYIENVGKCQVCGKGTASGAFRLCPAHALEGKKCSRCLAPFPPQATPGIRLAISWLHPKLRIKDTHITSDSNKSLPVWVSITNTTKKDVTAPELRARGPNPQLCETLLFLVTAGGKERVLFNISPWIKRRRALAPRPLVLKPGVTTFECDLGKCYSALGPLPTGRFSVRAAAGWLGSNTLTAAVGGGGATVVGPAVDPKDPRSSKALAELREGWKMAIKQGRFAEAVAIARRITRLHPDLGRKMLMMSEVYMKKHHKRDAERKKMLEEKRRREEELKRRMLD